MALVAMLWLPLCLACMGHDDENDDASTIVTTKESLPGKTRVLNVLSPIATAIVAVAIAMWAY